MNGELNKLFGREFLVGFFLPALVFLILLSAMATWAGEPIHWLKLDAEDPLKKSALVGLLAYALGICLQALNREINRVLEGYWVPQWLRAGGQWYYRWRFRRLRSGIQELTKRRTEHEKSHPATQTFPDMAELIRLSARAATEFPSGEEHILPTKFGNRIRAIEDYPRVMYGFESIGGWARLQSAIPKQTAELISGAKAQLDFWINLLFLYMVSAATFLGWNLRTVNRDSCLALAVIVAIAWLLYTRVNSSAILYGEPIKAAYDLWLKSLASQLGYKLSSDPQRNRRFWHLYSRAILYRNPERLTEMAEAGLEREDSKPGSAGGAEKTAMDSDADDGDDDD